MRHKKVIISFAILCLIVLNACSYITDHRTAQYVENKKNTRSVPVQSLNVENVIDILNSINKILFLFEEESDSLRKREFYMKLNDYIYSDKMDYTSFACNRYGKLICLDLDYTPQLIEQKEREYQYLVSYKIFPNTDNEFYSEGVINFFYNEERNVWLISKISEPYCAFLYNYMAGAFDKLENDSGLYDIGFGGLKLNTDMPTKEEMDFWLQIAGDFQINNTQKPLFLNQGYILNKSDKVLLHPEEFEKFDCLWTYFAIQEIYARHGKKFNARLLQWYFGLQEWYQPWNYVFQEEKINQIEQENIKLLMSHGDFFGEFDSKSAFAKYVNTINDYDLSNEKAECIISNMEQEIKDFIRPNFSLPIESEETFGGYELETHQDLKSMRDFLLKYVDEGMLEKTLALMQMAGIHYVKELDCYCMYTGGELVFYSVDTTRPFNVMGQDKEQYMVEVPIWIGSVYGLGPSRSLITLRENERCEWVIMDIDVDLDNVMQE